MHLALLFCLSSSLSSSLSLSLSLSLPPSLPLSLSFSLSSSLSTSLSLSSSLSLSLSLPPSLPLSLSLPPSLPLSLFLSLSSTEAASRVEERLLRLQTVLCQHRDRLHYVEFGRGRGIQQWAGKIREGQLAAMWCVYFRTHPNQSCKDRQFVSGSVFYCATHVCLKTSVRQCVCNPRMDENKLRNTSIGFDILANCHVSAVILTAQVVVLASKSFCLFSSFVFSPNTLAVSDYIIMT